MFQLCAMLLNYQICDR